MEIFLAQMPAQIQQMFHKSQMERVKKEVKKKITFVAHVQHGSKYSIQVRLVNGLGGKDEINFPLTCLPNQMSGGEYDFIIETINSGEYGS